MYTTTGDFTKMMDLRFFYIYLILQLNNLTAVNKYLVDKATAFSGL